MSSAPPRQSGHAVVMTAARIVGGGVRTVVLYDDGAIEVHAGSAVGPLERRAHASEALVEAWRALIASFAFRASTTERAAHAPARDEVIVTAHGASLVFDATSPRPRSAPSTNAPPARRAEPRRVLTPVESAVDLRAHARAVAEDLLAQLDGAG